MHKLKKTFGNCGYDSEILDIQYMNVKYEYINIKSNNYTFTSSHACHKFAHNGF